MCHQVCHDRNSEMIDLGRLAIVINILMGNRDRVMSLGIGRLKLKFCQRRAHLVIKTTSHGGNSYVGLTCCIGA